jgi:hypothetical protein
VVLVVPHAGLLLDEVADPARSPQSAAISHRLGPALERTLDTAQLARAEFRGTTRAPGLAQAADATLLELPRPATDRLPVHTQLARHLGLAESFAQQTCPFQPSLLQLIEVPPHTRWITHAQNLAYAERFVTILCRTQ